MSANSAEDTPPSPVQSRQARSYRAVALGVFVAGLAFSLVVWHFIRQEVLSSKVTRFKHQSEMIVEMIVDRVGQHVSALQSMRAFYDASERVYRDEWQKYIHDIKINHYQGALGFAFVRYVRRDNIELFLSDTRADGAPDFQIETAGDHSELGVVEFYQALNDTPSLQGYDLAQDPESWQTLVNAFEGEQLMASSSLPQLPVFGGKTGLLLALPVHHQGITPEQLAQRKQMLR